MKSNILLLAEDLEDDVFLFERALQRHKINCVVRVANNGKQAVDYLMGKGDYANREDHPLPSLVLMDIKMPELDGLEALEQIRKEPRLSQIPVVIFTSSKDERDVQRAYDLKANAYVVKPSDPGKFAEALESLTTFWFEFNVSPHRNSGSI